MIGCRAGTLPVIVSPFWSSSATSMLANFGKYFDSGSSISSLPRSCSCSAASATIGLVIDAMLKIVSLVIATSAALSRKPNVS